ncbi:DUF6314 family protein [Roseobacter ponti]|uniref:Trigger factor n=1 Tax=Roseobacter ponti TaxID=1891787 RepID=A0A858SU84_9RHOB|nr:DUF6314 family protein [Roseobacter ponti]QJF51538.1 trigger factor [Roseobacter ponti]
MTPDPRVLADFAGDWRLCKNVVQADGTRGRFEGTASWHPAGTGAEYTEAGRMTLGDAPPFHATRRYRWSQGLEVSFEDGRFFHQVPALGGATTHWCDPDRYDVVYDFSAWPEFNVSWRVKGPRKDYTLQCQYRRP